MASKTDATWPPRVPRASAGPSQRSASVLAGSDAASQWVATGVGSLHPRRPAVPSSTHERAGLRGQQHFALALPRPKLASMTCPELERRLGRVRVLEEAGRSPSSSGGSQGFSGGPSPRIRRRVRPQRIVVHVDQRPARRVRRRESGWETLTFLVAALMREVMSWSLALTRRARDG